jgi:hypothetical protein
MLITGELRDLRNSKGSTELSAASLEIPVSGVKQNVSNLVFSLCMSESWTRHEIQQGHCFIAPTAHFLLRQP